MSAFFLLLLVLGISFIAINARWTGFKIASAMSWIVLWIYFAISPPFSIVPGSAVHVSIMLLCVLIGIMFGAYMFRQNGTRTRLIDGNLTETGDFGGFKVPAFLRGRETPVERLRKRQSALAPYRNRVHNAVYGTGARPTGLRRPTRRF